MAKFSTDFENGPDEFVPIDSVGGCTTLVRADVHREGALFAPYYVIGAAWDKDGYDGVESEGAWALPAVAAAMRALGWVEVAYACQTAFRHLVWMPSESLEALTQLVSLTIHSTAAPPNQCATYPPQHPLNPGLQASATWPSTWGAAAGWRPTS